MFVTVQAAPGVVNSEDSVNTCGENTHSEELQVQWDRTALQTDKHRTGYTDDSLLTEPCSRARRGRERLREAALLDQP